MTIASTLKHYLDNRGVDYRMLLHPRTERARESARSANLPPHQIAKAVVLKDDGGYVIAVVPAHHSLEIGWVNEELGRTLTIASESDFQSLFGDCDCGAVPALGDAYGMQVIWDDDLQYTADVYIEAGDHEHLVWLERRDFRDMMANLPHNIISKDLQVGCWKY
ncbi:MAG: YbaK/EbsC family protein [Lysobacterales bacterium]|jgi:Ala-tRNA(Pro) deacylase